MYRTCGVLFDDAFFTDADFGGGRADLDDDDDDDRRSLSFDVTCRTAL